MHAFLDTALVESALFDNPLLRECVTPLKPPTY